MKESRKHMICMDNLSTNDNLMLIKIPIAPQSLNFHFGLKQIFDRFFLYPIWLMHSCYILFAVVGDLKLLDANFKFIILTDHFLFGSDFRYEMLQWCVAVVCCSGVLLWCVAVVSCCGVLQLQRRCSIFLWPNSHSKHGFMTHKTYILHFFNTVKNDL